MNSDYGSGQAIPNRFPPAQVIGIGGQLGQLASEMKQRAVPAALSRLGNSTEKFRALLDELEKRLSPAILPCPTGEKCGAQPTCGCELADAIDSQSFFIANNNDRLQSLLQRIEL